MFDSPFCFDLLKSLNVLTTNIERREKKKDVSVHDTKADTWRARTAHSKR